MAWIEVIPPGRATGRLAALYELVASADGHVDAILQVHSLRPRTLEAHLALYKATLHSRPNGLSPRERELVGAVVSRLNGCDYCVRHHVAGLTRHTGDEGLARRLVDAAFESPDPSGDSLTDRERALCAYATRLTRDPGSMVSGDLEPLRAEGLGDDAILDLDQVVAYFAYANRVVQGLGVEAGDEPLGLHPDEERDDLRHA